MKRTTLRLATLSILSLLMGLLVQLASASSPAAAADGNIVAPFTQGEQWYVMRGYDYASHTGTSSKGLDLTLGTSLTSTSGKTVRAPMAGTIYYWDAPNGNLCVNTPSGRSYTLTHINASKTSGAVAVGESLGTVAPAGQRNNANVAHLHFEVWSGGGCYGGGSSPATLESGNGLRICGAPNLTASGPSAGNGTWSGTYFTAQSCDTGNNPIGSYDELTSPQPGTVRVRGWALDMDAKTTPIAVHVYVGGPAGSGAPGFAITADKSRPDVGAAYPGTGNNHGYDSTLETSRTGSVPVYVYAINAGGTGGGNQLIGARTVAVTSGNPQGNFDVATSSIPGKVRISGWAFDPSARTTPVTMHLYVGGPAGAAGAVGYDIGPAGDVRSDVGAAYPGVGNNHGYERHVAISQSGSLTVYLYAIDLAGTPGDNVLLGSKTVSVLAAPQPMASTVAPGLSGKARVGKRLTTDGGTWSQPGVTLTYQWFRGGKALKHATSSSYKMRSADLGRRLKVRVTATKDGYATVTVTSSKSKKVKR